MRIVQVANFVTDHSGGQRRALLELGARYVAAGHTCTLVVPGERRHLHSDGGVDVIALPGVTIPTSGGYRMLLRRRPLQRLLNGLGPDVVELSDKTTLAWLPAYLKGRGVTTVLLVHERHDDLLQDMLPAWVPWRELVRGWSARAAVSSDAVVCASAYAAEQFASVTAANIVRIPLGVDVDVFHPDGPVNRPATNGVELVYVGRLSPEKRPEIAIATLAELLLRGLDARLTVVGDGPLLRDLTMTTAGLPVTFLGRVDDRAELAAILRGARALLASCPVESFGLAIVEALACGTPAVVANRGGAAELVTDTAGLGVSAVPEGRAFADAVEVVLAGDRGLQALACRRHAERFSWDRTAASMLTLFDTVVSARRVLAA